MRAEKCMCLSILRLADGEKERRAESLNLATQRVDVSAGRGWNARSPLPELISATTTTATKPVNNTSMTIWKARASGALRWAFAPDLK